MKKAHFMGICGMGMGALAVLLKNSGWTVSGSDEGFYEPAAGYLKRHGISILTPYRAGNIPSGADLVVIGKHAKLSAEENEEVRKALEAPEKIKSFPEVLGEITAEKENIVVAGSYGKSTCTALLAWCLRESGIDAGYFVGAVPIGMEENARLGSAKYFALEGDEYPAWNGESKFLYFHPHDVLLTSGEHDHVNVFPDENSYLEPYKKLMKLVPNDGLLVAAIENPNVKKIAEECGARVVGYGFKEGANWRAVNIKYAMETSFELWNGEEKVAELRTVLLGRHNIENIVGVSAMLLEKKIISKDRLVRAVKSFRGLVRRLDLKTKKSAVPVYESFGSSYAKAKSAFQAIKLHFPGKRIITIFEPHTFSWRNRNNLGWYGNIFKDSSVTILLKPPEHGKDTHEQASFEEILGEAKKGSKNVYGSAEKQEVIRLLKENVQKDDVVILMTSGDLGGLIEEIPALMEKMFPQAG